MGEDLDTYRRFKRVLAFGDMHCGHRAGLTPPKYQSQARGHNYFEMQRECHAWFSEEVEKLKPIDILIDNADNVDGKGRRSGGTELIHPDIGTQCDMAVDNIEIVEADSVVMTYGTGYHVGDNNDWEDRIARSLNDRGTKTSIRSQQWVDVNGVIFDCKHAIGSSSIPYGRQTAIQKENMWNLYWNDIGEQPRSDIFLRSHVHFFSHGGDGETLAVVLPALQAAGTKFGGRRCSGVVRFGFCYFDCYEDGGVEWSWRILRAESQKIDPLVL